ncbi:MAG: carboxypeptidase-like regulatory domain-containing protein [Actinomycetota bacterium]
MSTTLFGTVTRPTGEPAHTATVELHNSSGDILDQIVCDSAGRFRYHLSPGAWQLFVWDPAGNRAQVSVELQKDEETAIRIDLAQGGEAVRAAGGQTN